MRFLTLSCWNKKKHAKMRALLIYIFKILFEVGIQ